MAVLTVKEIQNTGRTGGEDERGHRRYRRVFRVETDNALDGQYTVMAAVSVRRYDKYVDPNGKVDNAALAVAMDAQPEDQDYPFHWIVTVDYSSEIWDQILRATHSGGKGATGTDPGAVKRGDSNDPQNPVNLPSEITITALHSEALIKFDKTGKSIRNSAGDLFDGGLTMDETIEVVTIRRAEVAFDRSFYHLFWGKVNSDIFLGSYPGYALCKSITGEVAYQNGYVFWWVTYTFHVLPNAFYRGFDAQGNANADYDTKNDGLVYAKANGWNVRDGLILDAGWRDKNSKAAKRNTDGSMPVRPALLDGTGLFLANQTDTPKWLQFVVHNPRLFSTLNLP